MSQQAIALGFGAHTVLQEQQRSGGRGIVGEPHDGRGRTFEHARGVPCFF